MNRCPLTDLGSQIIAMSEAVCHDIGLAYDPSIKLNMQSANSEVDQLLGLSHNVSCKINSIILYLQIHIIRSPAYNILLGRPFDILTKSTIKNFPNEDQTITIVDPNTKRSITIPTLPWAPPHCRRNGRQGFHSSRDQWREKMTMRSLFLLILLIPQCLLKLIPLYPPQTRLLSPTFIYPHVTFQIPSCPLSPTPLLPMPTH
jgi:hypothetical protein